MIDIIVFSRRGSMSIMIEISTNLVGKELGEDILSESGLLLLKSGTVLTNRHIIILQNQIERTKVKINQEKEIPKENSLSYLDQHELELQTLYEESLAKIKEKLSLIKKEQVPFIHELKEIYIPVLEKILNNDNMSSLLKVMQQSSKDYLYEHSLNVAIMSTIIGRLLGQSKNELFELAEMGLLHDIGMLALPERILNKPSKLHVAEEELVRHHTSKGTRILQKMGEKRESIIKAALLHHERMNGSGYPKKLVGQQIPFSVQIIAVADIFTAMTSVRPFRDSISQLQACHELMNEMQKGYYSPAIVIPFVRYIMRQHLGEKIKLSNGKNGKLVFIHENEPHQPLVQMEDGSYIDLRKEKLTFIGNTLS